MRFLRLTVFLILALPLETSAGEFHLAARDGSDSLVREQLRTGADVNERDHSGATPLNWAAAEGHLQIAKLLIEKGASVNAKNKQGGTPLHAAAVTDQAEMVEFLVSNGALAGRGKTLRAGADGAVRGGSAA